MKAIFGRKSAGDAEWFLAANMPSEEMISIGDWRDKNRGRTTADYVQLWLNENQNKLVRLTMPPYDRELADEISRRSKDFKDLALITTDMPIKLTLKKCRIHSLNIGGATELDIDECIGKNISFVRAANVSGGYRPSDVRIRRSKIGSLTLAERTIASLDVEKSEIQQLNCPLPSNNNPFLGSVSIRKTKLLPLWRNAQHYRNARHHLAAIHNHDAASIFHAAELRTELQRQSFVDRWVNRAYGLISNYGESTARPLLWLAAFILANIALLYALDGVVLLGDVSEADGWRYSLYGLGNQARLFRAIGLAFSQLFNPLGIFGAKSIFAAKTPMLEVATMTIGFLGTLSLGLFVLSLRRRFRLDRTS